MASKYFPMMRYTVDPHKSLIQNLAIVTAMHQQHFGTIPTVAHVSPCHQAVPEQIGPIKVVQAWGLYPFEIDLGVE